MKVLFLINSLTSGGAEKVILTILSKLIEDNIHVELICLEKNNFYNLPNNLKVTYLSNKSNSNGLKKLFLMPYYAFKLKKYVKKNNIKIIQSHLYRSNYINVMAKLFGSSHQTQIVNHGIVSRYRTKGVLGKINLLLIKILYLKANLLIFISKGMQQDFNKLYNFNKNQIIINNPYDINDILKLQDEKIENFIFKKGTKYIITMGRLVTLKRYQDVIEAISNLSVNTELIVLGNGPERANLITLSDSLGIKNKIHFLGNVKNPFKYLSKADIFILSSETEGFPNSIIEALACKTTVIASDCISGPREIIAPNSDINTSLNSSIEITEYGILYPVGNVILLSEGIDKVLNDNKLVETLRKSSQKRAEQFSVNKIINQYKKVLEIE